MVNYIDLISEFYPNIEVSCEGDTSVYENITWYGEQISKEELDSKIIIKAQFDKINELSDYARSLIIVGFDSDALETGVFRHYDGNIEDQLNIAGATAVALSDTEGFTYPSRDLETMTKSYLMHSPSQMAKVAADGANFKLNILRRFNDLKVYILTLTDTTEIQGINWETVLS